MIKQSLTFILTVLISVISGCTTTSPNIEKRFVAIEDVPRLLNNKKLTLNYSVNNKNKEYFISALLKEEYEFEIEFSDDGKKLNNNLLDSNLSFFCNSYIEDQRYKLNSWLYEEANKHEDILVVYSEGFETQANTLKKNYPNSKYYFLNNSNYENFVIRVIGVDSSVKRFNELQKNDKSISILNTPREKKDFKKIYFLTDYVIGKTLIPIFRSYLIDTDFYSTVDILLGASSVKELNDFENMIIPAPEYFFKNLSSKKITTNLREKLNQELVEDLILAETIYQNNLFGVSARFNSGNAKINSGQCINRELYLMKVSINT